MKKSKKKPKTIMPWPVYKYSTQPIASEMVTADSLGSIESIETLESIESIDDIINVQTDKLGSIESLESIDDIINVKTDNLEAMESIDGIVNIIQPDNITSIVNIQTNKSIEPIGKVRKLSENPLRRHD